MRIGLVGWPGSGKSTLFKALGGVPQPGARGGIRVDSWPLVSVDVPDERLAWLRELCQPRKFTPARIEFVDFAGLSRSSDRGKGELLTALREVDALCLVVRAFRDDAYPHERPEPDPEADLASLREELLFADFAAVEARIERLEVQVKKPTRTQERDRQELQLLERLRPGLEAGRPLRELGLSSTERPLLSGFRFLSEKSALEVYNVPEADLNRPGPPGAARCSALLEAEIAALSPQERREFLAGYGLSEPFRETLIRMGYATLGLCSFFTIGEDEVRAWTLRAGENALAGAGKIHTDLARGFIRAEVIAWQALSEAGSQKAARAAGLFRLAGKAYVVQGGDILNIRFSV